MRYFSTVARTLGGLYVAWQIVKLFGRLDPLKGWAYGLSQAGTGQVFFRLLPTGSLVRKLETLPR